MTYPLGIDVSSYQRTMDWQRAIDTGAKFAFCKASEGASWTASGTKRIYAVFTYEVA